MLHKLLKTRRPAADPPRVPDGQRVYAIGDVHGCDDLLAALLAKIDADNASRGSAETTVIMLGDLIDRGPDSAAVVERVRRRMAERGDMRLLMGNHEEVFLRALGGDERAMRFLCRFGGRETIMSYGMSASEYDALDFAELLDRLGSLVPPEHRTLLAAAEDMIEVGDYVFVHAGIRPDLPLDQQRTSDLRWIREPFLDWRASTSRRIVHGHSISSGVDFTSTRIGLDTGAYSNGLLSALMLEGATASVLDVSHAA
jgi:serine/threonine protein phosphatase 1